MKYPKQSQTLVDLLFKDQQEWRAYAKAQYVDKLSQDELDMLKDKLRHKVVKRAESALRILDEIENKPSLDYISSEAATALSVLATHHSLDSTKKVLVAFEQCYQDSPNTTQKQSIPAMTDWVAILEGKPQVFGTIWLFDKNLYPFLPTIQDVENINQKRKEYGIEALRWPKSLAIPEKDQPWLKRPVSEAIMRSPTNAELHELVEFD